MLETLFWVVVGAFVGWNVKRPLWSVRLQQRIMSFFTKE